MHFCTTICLLVVFALCVLAAEDYYKLLGLDKDASDRDIKKAYRRLSKQYHPDKNPDDETAKSKFVEIADAYEVLSDDKLRNIYNTQGHAGVEHHRQTGGRGGGHAHDPFDLFSRFFGGGGHFGQQGVRRGPSMEVRVHVPLKLFYEGGVTEFGVEKQQICEACGGSGSADGEAGVHTCGGCGGRGQKIAKQQLAPGIFQQFQSTCDECGGRGKIVKHRCSKCEGTRVVRQVEMHELEVEKGMPRGARVTYENEADESPDWEAGDLIVVLAEADPQIGNTEEDQVDGTFFRRKGDDLFWTEVLSLREAWMGGWTRNLTHLDGHTVLLHRPRGSVVQPRQVDVINGEGMPIWNWAAEGPEYGRLHVEYVVVLPDQMDAAMEKDFHALWEKWRRKSGVDLLKDSGRPAPGPVKHNEL